MICAVYARKSNRQDGRAEEERSVAAQLDLARAYAARHGWTIAPEHVYAEADGNSGAEFEDRDQFMRLMAALTPRAPVDVLLLYDKDRLGREQWELTYSLKKLDQAGVAIHETKDGGGPLRFDSPADRMQLSVMAAVADFEREKTRVRTRDALRRKAERGHVVGGIVFGYTNHVVTDAAGKRSHVERRVVPAEAKVVRTIFTLISRGLGYRRVAHTLNRERALAPRPRRGRPAGWAPSSVREVVHRDLYRGRVVWGRSRKRDHWGQRKSTPRPAETWITTSNERLRIVSDALWQAAHDRLTTSRQSYLRHTTGKLLGKPGNGIDSKYLLTGLAVCGGCGGTVTARVSGRSRSLAYHCSVNIQRGKAVCAVATPWPLRAVDAAVLTMLQDQLLDPAVIP
jgi:site-specific DNA recombinase